MVQSDDGYRYPKLYEAGWKKEEIQEAFRLLSWMMKLPDTEYLIYKKKMITYEKENPMNTTPLLDFEEYGLKQGRREGRQDTILELLELRFGDVPKKLMKTIREIHEEKRPSHLFKVAAACVNIKAFSAEL